MNPTEQEATTLSQYEPMRLSAEYEPQYPSWFSWCIDAEWHAHNFGVPLDVFHELTGAQAHNLFGPLRAYPTREAAFADLLSAIRRRAPVHTG